MKTMAVTWVHTNYTKNETNYNPENLKRITAAEAAAAFEKDSNRHYSAAIGKNRYNLSDI